MGFTLHERAPRPTLAILTVKDSSRVFRGNLDNFLDLIQTGERLWPRRLCRDYERTSAYRTLKYTVIAFMPRQKNGAGNSFPLLKSYTIESLIAKWK